VYTFLAMIVITTTYVGLQAKEIEFINDILFFVKIILKKTLKIGLCSFYD